MILWGLLSACTAEGKLVSLCCRCPPDTHPRHHRKARSYGSLLAVRILLGIVECAFFPGASESCQHELLPLCYSPLAVFDAVGSVLHHDLLQQIAVGRSHCHFVSDKLFTVSEAMLT